MIDEAQEALERVGIRPGDVVTSNASSRLALWASLDTSCTGELRFVASEWVRPGELALVLGVALSHDDDSEARPAALLLVLSERQAMGWTTELTAYEAFTWWR